jgi:histidinol-phosphate aminotransferase
MMQQFPEPKAFIPAILPYPPGKPIEDVQREYGLDSVIKLASNENPLGPSPKAVKAMTKVAGEMHLYPDGAGFYLKQALARKHGVKPEQICLANGSDEITDLIATAYIEPSHNVVVSQYDFISYRLAAMMVGAEVREAPLRSDWRADVRALLEKVDANTRLVCIANPSNPIGTMVKRAELTEFLNKVPPTTLVLIDEAYCDYAQDKAYPNGLSYLKKHPNLIVTRTFSKAYGLAGLRIGAGFAHPEIVKNFDRVRAPFNTSRIAQAAALAALDDTAHLKRTVEANEKGRALFETAFKKMGLDYVPSQTNFLLIEVGYGAEITEALMRLGVIVRPMGGYGLPNHIRVTIGTPAENRRFLAALKSVMV